MRRLMESRAHAVRHWPLRHHKKRKSTENNISSFLWLYNTIHQNGAYGARTRDTAFTIITATRLRWWGASFFSFSGRVSSHRIQQYWTSRLRAGWGVYILVVWGLALLSSVWVLATASANAWVKVSGIWRYHWDFRSVVLGDIFTLGHTLALDSEPGH
ncbi:hypothetical protein N658DRAFT_41223 [Parathielavia hyrcaniae]|uniref:Uncharacterized protein n=1 Tax=Parathielavia hyrcaniae TaxID=113614 RepID=A0AAN6T2I4_9PEZI|nr:hypothetical protein N658DRAFT_41223 [Parathielavia hyrcaniae]